MSKTELISVGQNANIRLGKVSFYKISSYGEQMVANYLVKRDIQFVSQAIFKDCKDKRLLPFDFYVPEYNMVIEIDGGQHKKSVGMFGGKAILNSTKKHDQQKIQYCADHGIRMIRLNYAEQNKNGNTTRFYKTLDKAFEFGDSGKKDYLPEYYWQAYKKMSELKMFENNIDELFYESMKLKREDVIKDSIDKIKFDGKVYVENKKKELKQKYVSDQRKSHSKGGKASKVKKWLTTLDSKEYQELKNDVVSLSTRKFKKKWKHDRRAVEKYVVIF